MKIPHSKKPGPQPGQPLGAVKRSAFGSRLFTARKARGLTQTQLGELVGVSKRMIAFYEGDNQGPPIELTAKLAQSLNITVSYLAGESPLKTIKDDLSPTVRKYAEILQKLPPKDQKTALRIIDSLSAENKA